MNHELISRIQQTLNEAGIPAWLFYDFQKQDPIGRKILKIPPDAHITRRWFYLVPASGEPVKLVHRIETAVLDHLPGSKEVYLKWGSLHASLQRMLEGLSAVAMQFSEKNSIPYISRVDGGTIELVRSCEAQVVSAGNLIQRFEAVWSPAQVEHHRQAARLLTSIAAAAYEKAQLMIQGSDEPTEMTIQEFILERFEALGLVTDFSPIVAVNENSGNPHYQPTPQKCARIRKGDFLLIDLWARRKAEDAVFADITWTGYFGEKPPSEVTQVFDVVRRARDRGVQFLRDGFNRRPPLQGWEVDDEVREEITKAGYGEYFVHRTGHNLGQEEVHGNGVHFDNLETHDTRTVLPGVGCTIEPGIYLNRFGVRSEINVYMAETGPEVTTPPQNSLLVLPV